jgi:hypothetical protein
VTRGRCCQATPQRKPAYTGEESHRSRQRLSRILCGGDTRRPATALKVKARVRHASHAPAF